MSIVLLLLSFFVAATPLPIQTIDGRPWSSMERLPVYRAEVPPNWKREDSPTNIEDTRLPLCTYRVGDIVVTIHNFPEKQIPPMAQVERWRRQLKAVDPLSLEIRGVSQGGFAGLRLEATGIIAYAMQVAPEHYRHLSYGETPREQHYERQMRADYTIKAQGPPEQLEKKRKEIDAFAHSFELIDEIPS